MSLREADALAPQIKLAEILKTLVPKHYKLDRVIVMTPGYFLQLNQLLAMVENDTLHHYFLWKAVQSYWSLVEDVAVEPLLELQNFLAGKVN
jgi:endothelin-converting enzyme